MRDAYRADKDKAFRIVFGQYMSWYQTFIGDYPGAHESYSIRQLAARDDAPSPLGGDWSPKPALDAIAGLARGRKAIFLNEAHNVPITRSLTVQLLPRLRAEGYTYFAAETLYESDAEGLRQRGYPIPKSGFYTMEPIAAEMVRSAIRLGFKIVAYESEPPGNGDVREYAQRLHASFGEQAETAVLTLVEPEQRRVEIVTGAVARRRLDDRAAGLVSLSMATSFAGGDLAGGVVNGVRMMAQSAARPRVLHESEAD